MIKNLRKLRLSKGLSQQKLADVIETSQQSINKYENQNVEPDIRTLIKLADYFNTSIDYLVGHIENGNKTGSVMIDMTQEESELIYKYRVLSNGEKDSIRLIIENYLENKSAKDK